MPALPTKFSIRHSLFAIILLITLTALMAMVMSAIQYEKFIHKIEKSAIEELLEIEINDLHAELVQTSTELGIALQKIKGLRKAISDGDIAATVPFLNDHFHQYFVTAEIIDLQKIYLLDKNYKYLAQSSDGKQNIDLQNTLCTEATQTAKKRTGSDRLKAISSLCYEDELSLLSVIVPIGTLRPVGFLQIVTDPSYNAHQISKNINMPIEVKQINNVLRKRTKNWPTKNMQEDFIFVDYTVHSKNNQKIYRITAAKDVRIFREAFNSTTITVLSYSIPLFILGLIAAGFISRKGLKALNSLTNSAQTASQGNFKKINDSGYIELDKVIHSFNLMIDKIKNNQSTMEQEIETATRNMQEAKLLVEKRNLELQSTIDLVEKANTTKSSFLANMSHELRTPLNAVIGYSEMLAEDLEELKQPQLITDINKIHTAGNHLLSLVNDILDLSKIEAGKLELNLSQVNLANIIDEAITTIRPTASNNGNKITVSYPDSLKNIHSDAMRLKQIILNIIHNAVKFTNNGSIKITVSEDNYLNNDVYLIKIEDTGIGIKPELISKLFQPFYQADESATRKFGGTGLGLALSKQLIEGLSGHIEVTSELGRGSIFTIRLPLQIYTES